MKTKIKNMEETPEEKIKNSSPQYLQFTGNWFIDAGILGFVNLMEKVYGWDLEELQKRIEKEREKVYYGYFPAAFVCYNNMINNNKIVENIKKLDEEDVSNSQNAEEIFEKAWKFIEENYSTEDKKRIKLKSKGPFLYFHNFLFFQPSWKKEKQKNAFKEILGLEEIRSTVLKNIDKTINKFLPSSKEFSNLSYTKSFIDIHMLKKILPNQSIIFLLTFPFAFVSIISKVDKIFFYSPNIDFTYKVNKKIEFMKDKINKKGAQDKNTIFYITIKSIFDSLIEEKSIWSIENMYLITYKLGEKQNIFDVEYIGIPKLQASIIIDDQIRENLNKSIRIRSKNFKGNKYVWLIKEFIQGKPLYPLILRHVEIFLNEESKSKHFHILSLLYSLIVDAKVLEFIKNKNRTLFSSNYFDNYKYIINEIKEEIRKTSFCASIVKKISEDKITKNRIAKELLSALKARDKNMFLNILIKNMNKDIKLSANKNLNDWIFNKIIKNDITFEMYGLILIIELIADKNA